MSTINGKACVVNGAPVDKVFSDGKQVYGRNLLTGTSNVQDHTMSGSGWVLGSQSTNSGGIITPVTVGASYTYSVIIKSTTFNCYPQIQFFDNNNKLLANSIDSMGTSIGMRKVTGIAPANAAFLKTRMVLQNPPDSQTVVFNSEKLELGTIATPWTPAPEDVM